MQCSTAPSCPTMCWSKYPGCLEVSPMSWVAGLGNVPMSVCTTKAHSAATRWHTARSKVVADGHNLSKNEIPYGVLQHLDTERLSLSRLLFMLKQKCQVVHGLDASVSGCCSPRSYDPIISLSYTHLRLTKTRSKSMQ